MLNNILAPVTVPPLGNPLLQGIFTFVLGMFVVFFGIAIIVVFVQFAGNIFNKTEKKEEVKKVEIVEEPKVVVEEGIPEKVKVAIIAAISAYYFNNNENKSNCDFVVRKIKRF